MWNGDCFYIKTSLSVMIPHRHCFSSAVSVLHSFRCCLEKSVVWRLDFHTDRIVKWFCFLSFVFAILTLFWRNCNCNPSSFGKRHFWINPFHPSTLVRLSGAGSRWQPAKQGPPGFYFLFLFFLKWVMEWGVSMEIILKKNKNKKFNYSVLGFDEGMLVFVS